MTTYAVGRSTTSSDLGHLALADATLGALLVDMLTVLAHAGYPEAPLVVDPGLTTKQAARVVRRCLEAEPELFGDTAKAWLSDVTAVADSRNELFHAVALDRCGMCGAVTRFVHPRSGHEVDRSEQAVRDLTARALAVHKDGTLVAEQIAERVNARIVARARLDAEATGEIQNPPQVYPHYVTHKCETCTGNGRGSTTIRVDTAVEVWTSVQCLQQGCDVTRRECADRSLVEATGERRDGHLGASCCSRAE